jgi:3-oxoacyl-[acyl-carrier protein] reductase
MGQAQVRGLARAGWRAIAVDLNQEALTAFAREADAEGLAVVSVCADVCAEASVATFVSDVRKSEGRIDVLVNNVGVAMTDGRLIDTSLDAWEATIRLNLTSQFLCVRAVPPTMIAQRGGRIINIASSSAFSGITAALYKRDNAANLVAYVAAKGGVIGLTRALARELGPLNITLNAVAPVFTPTPRVQAKFSWSVMDRMVADQALTHLQEPDDATGAVVFLASDAARFVTGQVIHVDGGGSMG